MSSQFIRKWYKWNGRSEQHVFIVAIAVPVLWSNVYGLHQRALGATESVDTRCKKWNESSN